MRFLKNSAMTIAFVLIPQIYYIADSLLSCVDHHGLAPLPSHSIVYVSISVGQKGSSFQFEG